MDLAGTNGILQARGAHGGVTMGKEVENVKTVAFSKKEDENDFKTVMIKLKAHFLAKKNTMHEMGKFHVRAQHSGKCITTLLRALCYYGTDKYVNPANFL